MARSRRRVGAPRAPEIILRPGDESVLREAARQVGSGKLAEAFGVTRATLRRWVNRGITSTAARGAKKVAVRKALASAEAQSREDEKTFIRLMKKSGNIERPSDPKRTGPPQKQKFLLPRIRTGEGRRSGKLTAGYQWTLGIHREVTADVLREYEEWASKLPRKYPWWQSVAVTSQYALRSSKQFAGYKSRVMLIQFAGEPTSGNFQVAAEVPTPRSHDKRTVIRSQVKLIKDALEDGLLRMFVHAFTVFNYRMRTEREVMEFASRQRRERELRAAKKATRKKAPKKTKRVVKKRATKKTAKRTKKVTKKR